MTEILLLRLIHVVGGTFWVGAGVFSGLFLMPALAQAGPAAGQVMAGMQRRHLFMVLPTVAVLTILSGLRLMWITSGGFAPAYFATGRGATFVASGGAAILAFLLALFVVRPAAVRAGALGTSLGEAAHAPARDRLTVELERVRHRSAVVGRIVTLLLILAAAGMGVARYVP